MSDLPTEVLPLTAERTADFWAVHGDEHEHGWCCCTAWWSDSFETFSKRTADENRSHRERLFAEGHFDGYLVYADGRPVGWCQCGPIARLGLLRRFHGLDATPPDVVGLTCFFIVPSARGRGLARRLLDDVLADLRTKPVRSVLAFPRAGDGHEAGEVWTGPERLFTSAGFVRTGGTDAHPVLELNLHPCSS